MSLTALPSEILIKIIGLTEPIDVRSCQLVCRRLHALVASSSYLQYILELDACGYDMPPVPRSDLGYEAMVQRLREHRKGWEDPSSCKPEFFELSPQPTISTYFAGGVLACGYANDELKKTMDVMDSIHFHQLPSKNKSINYSHWHHSDFGFSVDEFAFQPEIDLLVLIEGTALAPDDPVMGYFDNLRPSKSYRLHFRTMSTNDPHWLAGLPTLDTGLSGRLRERKFYENRIIISLYGRMVMLRSGADHQGVNAIVVWDWIEGKEVLLAKFILIIIPTYFQKTI
ncbi:unnamed protein product [Rhizoctonia solani]|uniref:F-box domain-containing protein n=1 Tax=Rhizoctonia solani TaxID=456999 RepID=A0A8H3CI43_9AGAM|nr:unnamed protein product [Rhizoctonia solani]